MDFGNKGLEVDVCLGAVSCAQKTVENNQRGCLPLRFLAQKLHNCGQSFLIERLEHTHVGNSVSQLFLLEEIQCGERLEEAIMRFCQESDVKDFLAAGGSGKRNLVADNGFACSRLPLNDI